MIEGEDYQAYRVHLLHGSWGLLWARLWGRTIGAGGPTYFDGEEVRKKRGKRGWPVDYWDAIRNKKFEISPSTLRVSHLAAQRKGPAS